MRHSILYKNTVSATIENHKTLIFNGLIKNVLLSHCDNGTIYADKYDTYVLTFTSNTIVFIWYFARLSLTQNILCADTDDDVAHYSVLNGSDQLYAAKYLTYMPSRANLRREIEQQKEFFLLQHKGENKE